MKNFSTSLSGYNKKEVIDFVNEVTDKYSNLLAAYKSLADSVSEKDKQIARYANLENTFNRAIMVAEETTAQMKRIAKDEGKNIIIDAKKNASRIINDALIKADHIDQDAENLKRKISQYKRRIKQIMEEQLEIIDEIEEFDPKY